MPKNMNLTKSYFLDTLVFYWSAHLKAFKFIFGWFTLPTDRIQLGLHEMAITTIFCQKS